MSNVVAFAIEFFKLVASSETLCVACCDPDSTHYVAIPLTQDDVNEWAKQEHRPILCDRCARRLTDNKGVTP